jgi:3-oxoacyl-[acyl-carrier protein] reductase
VFRIVLTYSRDIGIDDWEYTMNVNLRAPFLLVQGVVKEMKAQKWGRIVFTSSIAAYGTSINGAHYAASKGGLLALTKRLAAQLAMYNISVNDVAPAMVGGTGMISGPEAIPEVVGTIPLGRLGAPEEIANAVVMFVTTGYATGQSLVLAGGLK